MEKKLNNSFSQSANQKGFFDFQNRDSNAVDERVIWKMFKEGDESAFVYIYNSYYKTLLNLGVQFTKDYELIKDCLQDLFIDIRENRKKLGDVKYIKSYLMVSFKRRLLDYLNIENRNSDRHMQIAKDLFEVDVSHEQTFIEGQDEALNIAKLKQAVDQLSKKEMEAIYYFYYENLSYKEISEIFSYSQVKTARNLIYMALDKLRSIMKFSDIIIFVFLIHQISS